MLLDNYDIEAKTPVKKVRDHSGSRNPHFNHPHSDSAKAAISATQKERYSKIGELVKRGIQNPLTEERIMEIVRQTCAEYLAKNTLQTNNNRTNIIPL
jgi:hypothetical protein